MKEFLYTTRVIFLGKSDELLVGPSQVTWIRMRLSHSSNVLNISPTPFENNVKYSNNNNNSCTSRQRCQNPATLKICFRLKTETIIIL